MNDRLLDRETLANAFAALNDELRRAGVRADVYVFGGAAMILAYGVERATRDVDAVFEPHGPVIEAAQRVADREGLPRWWLNEQASAYLPSSPDDQAAPVWDGSHLRVAGASLEQMVALKAVAARAQDLDDLRVLASQLGLASAQDVFNIVDRVFPGDSLGGRKRLLIEDLFPER
jgi:hypothetical protein